MIWSKNLALDLAPIQVATVASATAQQSAPGRGSDLDGGGPQVAAHRRMLPVRPGC